MVDVCILRKFMNERILKSLEIRCANTEPLWSEEEASGCGSAVELRQQNRTEQIMMKCEWGIFRMQCNFAVLLLLLLLHKKGRLRVVRVQHRPRDSLKL